MRLRRKKRSLKTAGFLLAMCLGLSLTGCGLLDDVDSRAELGIVSAVQAINLLSSCTGVDPNAVSSLYDSARYAYISGLLSPAVSQAHFDLAGEIMEKLIEKEARLSAEQRDIFKDIPLSGGHRNLNNEHIRSMVNRHHTRCYGDLPDKETMDLLVETYISIKTGVSNSNTGVQRDLLEAIGALVIGNAATLLG